MIQVSVVIPTYNRKDRLPKALESVIAQEGVPFEVLVIDDGSTDQTKEMVLRDFPSVTCLSQPKQGPAAARNTGIENAKGEWIAFLDSDDEWLPGKLKAQIDYFARHPELRIAQTGEIWIRNGRRVNPMKKHRQHEGWIFEKCLPLCIISPSAVMIHREIFGEIGLFDPVYPACEDYELWLRITAKYPVGLIEQPYVVKYGGHADQRSREFPAMDRFRIQALAQLIASGTLRPDQFSAARAMLEEKAAIYIAGARKRGKFEEVEALQKILL
ncbi:MAG: glycosyltransferase [Candidatus Omnitrophota bacterium]|jgi:glycosyltransferase involved in cell wall biosynthesis